MAFEHKKALEDIVSLCEKATNPTRRSERIFDIALTALGLTANQREFEIRKVRQRVEFVQAQRVEKLIQKMKETDVSNNF